MKLQLPFVLLTTLLLVTEFASAQAFDSFQYRNLGPTRGGRVTAVAGTVAAPGTFYLGGSGAGVWKTDDYGETWKPVSDGYFASPSIGDIAVAQNDANIIYVGTGSDGLRSNVIAGKGMYKSTDGGESWVHIGLDNTAHIGAVEIDPRNHNTVWVAAIGQAFNANEDRGIYKTTDGGKTWNKVLFHSATTGFADIELLPGNPDIVFAAAWKAQRTPWTIISGGPADTGGIWKSVDGGQSWNKITKGLPEGLIGKIDFAISASDSSIVYALVEAPGDEGGLYKSVDQGESFAQVSSESGIRTRPFYYGNLDVDPQDANVLYAMATAYLKSVDGGESWTRLQPPHADNHDMWIDPNNPQLFIQGNDGGANITWNGGKTWSTQFNQPTVEVYQVEVDDQYPYWLYGGQQDNGTTIAVPSQAPGPVQSKLGWLVHTGGCETGPAVPKPGNHNIVYANCKGRFGVYDKRTGQEKGYYVGAANMYGHNPKDLRYRFQRVSPIHVSPHDPDVVYHGSQFVHRTTDDGVTWETISPDLTANEADKQVISGSPITRDITGEEFYSTLYSLRESPLQAGVIWTGANDGPVFVSRDNGENWQNVTPRMPKGGRVDSVEPSPHDATTAYVAVLRYQLGDWQPYIYKTNNFGQRWTLLTDGKNGIPADHPVRVVREDPVRPGLLYAGTEFGMFISLDDGESWQPFQQNLPVTPVTDIKVHRGDLVLSTMGRGFWLLDNVTTLRQADFEMTDDAVVLFQPKDTYRYRHSYSDDSGVPEYPRPAVVIDYYLPAADDDVRLEILDMNGQVVNSYRAADGEEAEEASESRDMASNEIDYVVDETLSTSKGMNRFRWDMTYRGAWHKDVKRRYRNGPMAAPGRYRLRLTVGSATTEHAFELLADPRVLEFGTSLANIREQVALQLQIQALLDDARRLEARLSAESDALTTRRDNDAISEADEARLQRVQMALALLRTEEGIYMQPKLVDQVAYLYGMLDDADQQPGTDARERHSQLLNEMSVVRSALAE
ncbi:WD40/YVTN/BNR-like repeat-containing protein [Woeseia oceani]|uniref:Sortilin N-terminal domain-containing protein n=1 Tax=Woeseia oceani TaxID=1548547 RepID=A0A193LJ94_9GAMM|nr:hypothetical protein [Woeseia oceani]ANO52605.1 hypothetical protein BA177_16715 [Woeseia oceani]